jgi:hypothetical protein
MKKLVVPLLWLILLAALLAIGAIWYEKKWGAEWPFPPHAHEHHH